VSVEDIVGWHRGMRYGIDEGWTCGCGLYLEVRGATPLARQQRQAEAGNRWAAHVSAEIASHLIDRLHEFDPSDDYHDQACDGAGSDWWYYEGIDRAIALIRGDIESWTDDPKAKS
jgi:hypothetical protein